MTARLRLGAQVAALATVAALLALLVWKVAVGSGDEVSGSLATGGRPVAPPFTLPRLVGGGELALESTRGKVVVLNFWASWCIPCKEETPLLQRASERWQDRGVTFVGVNAKDFRGDARSFLRRYRVTYANVYDGKGWTLGRYGISAFPETFFLDARGRVVYRVAGPVLEADEVDAGIERALRPA